MEDQHSLELFYKEAIQLSEDYLKKEYNAITLDEESSSGTACKITLALDTQNVDLIIRFPRSFPDTFPVIVLCEKSFNEIYPIPHLNSDRTLCIFDKNEAYPNADLPVEVVESVIVKAKEILEKGIKKLNTEDFSDEFAAYWDHSSRGYYFSIIDPCDEPKTICLYKFNNDGKSRAIFADSRLFGERWAENVYGKASEKEFIDALYLPLKGFGSPPFPRTNKEMYFRIKQHSPERLKNLLEFLQKSKRPSYIVFSLLLRDEYFLGLWVHLMPYKYKIYGEIKRKKTNVDGFRPGKAPVFLELMRDFPDTTLDLHSIERADRRRILSRGNSGNLTLEDKNISVIGCGSIGSNLVDKLVKLGANKLFLIDYDEISFENIARHFCGASYVNLKKTVAIEKKLLKHHPELIIKTYEKDIIELLLVNPNFLNTFDMNIICIGNTGVELRLNKLLKRSIISKPLLFAWVEPYLTAGHAVYIQPNKPGCLKCMFDLKQNFLFRDSVLKKPEQYTKREAGCQTSFVPYGAIEIDAFLVELTRFIMKVAKGLNDNTSWTWLGNLNEMRRLNRPLQSKWVGARSYTVYEKVIPQKFYCKDCLI